MQLDLRSGDGNRRMQKEPSVLEFLTSPPLSESASALHLLQNGLLCVLVCVTVKGLLPTSRLLVTVNSESPNYKFLSQQIHCHIKFLSQITQGGQSRR